MKFFSRILAKPYSPLLGIIGVGVLWRACILMITLLALSLSLPSDTAYSWIPANPWTPEGHAAFSALFSPLARWDAGFYVRIAQEGYALFADGSTTAVFFPLYPLFMRVVSLVTAGNMVIAGSILSMLTTLVSCVLLFLLAKKDMPAPRARDAVLFLLLFPYAFFFAAPYTESLFLMLALGAFLGARNKQWLAAGALAALAAATRPIGVLLVLALMAEHLRQYREEKKVSLQAIAAFFMAPLGLVAYSVYLWFCFGKPFLFLTAQSGWQRTFPLFSLDRNPISLLISYVHDSIIPAEHTLRYTMSNSLDLFFFLFGLTLSIYVFMRVRKSYGIFSLLAVLIPLFSGTLISMGRFVAVLFPISLALTHLTAKRPALRILLFVSSGIFLTLFTILFVHNYWIA